MITFTVILLNINSKISFINSSKLSFRRRDIFNRKKETLLKCRRMFEKVQRKKWIGYTKNEKKMRFINDACIYDIQSTTEYSHGSILSAFCAFSICST